MVLIGVTSYMLYCHKNEITFKYLGVKVLWMLFPFYNGISEKGTKIQRVQFLLFSVLISSQRSQNSRLREN